jgi:hypothetical protein
MNPNNKHITIITTMALFLCLWLNPGFSQDKVGTSAAPFLGINIGGAATAMGGAYVSMARDASALYWNPGAVSRLGKSELSFTHTSWIVNTSFNWGAVVLNLDGANAFGVNLAILDYGEENVTTVEAPEGNGLRWSAQDLAAAITYARNLTDRFSIGASAKYIQQKIYNESANGFALDIGLLYITRFNGMRLGVSMSNFGTDMKMDGKDLNYPYDLDPNSQGNNGTITSQLKTQAWPLPLFYRVGASMDLVKVSETTLMLAVDAVVPSDNSTIINVGGELNWNEIFFLRAGYKSLMRKETEEGLAAGVGFKYFVPGLGRIGLDYAYNDYGILQEIHTLGVSFTF